MRTIAGSLIAAFFTTVAFENSANVSFRGRTPNSWPGDEQINEASVDVPLNWYLSDAERAGLIEAIPLSPGIPGTSPNAAANALSS